jgi:hypothetical protein
MVIQKRSKFFRLSVLKSVVHASLLSITLVALSSCLFSKSSIEIKKGKLIHTSASGISVSNIQIINNQFIVTGVNLGGVDEFQIKDGASVIDLQIESKTATTIVANTLSNVTLAAGKVLDFVLSSVEASATFNVNFSLCNSTLGGKAMNCSVVPNDKEVLSYDATSGMWVPRAVNGLSYQGVWDANTSLPTTTTPGDYFIVSVAHAGYNVGDWIVFNGTSFDQIHNSSAISSVFGRTGAVVATKGDYTLTKLADVDLTTTPPTTNQVLRYDGTNWVPATVATSGGTVTGVTGTSPVTVTGTTAPVVSMAQANGSTNGYLASADWTTFNNKQAAITAGTTTQYYRGDKTFQTLDTSAVAENTNLYFTNSRVLGTLLAGFDNTLSGTVAATDSVLSAFGKVQKQITTLSSGGSNYLIKNSSDTISGTISLTNVITASGAGDIIVNSTPLGMTSAVNKTYADGKLDKTSGGTVAGVVTLDNDLKIKGGTNYVTLKGHASSANYNFVFPSSAGTSGYVLSTDGSGNLSWINPASTVPGTGTVTSASIVDGSIVDADISGTAAIAQSKILNLTTDLAAKQTTTLTSGNILVGNASNVATSVTMSGDATISNAGVLALKSVGTAGTYSSVTTDAQGRVVSGTAGSAVTSITGTAPIAVTGTASVPIISMPAAATGADGYLVMADWNTFNNKQSAITSSTALTAGSVTTNLQGGLVVNPYGTSTGNTGEVRLKELVANGTNYVGLKSPDALSADVILTLPTGVGTSGQVLTTSGTGGVLTWSDVATTSTTLTGDIGGTISANTIGAGKVTLSKLSATGTASASTYLRGDNTWSSLQTDVQALVLSNYVLGTNAVLSTSDTVVGAFGKLQKQVSDLASTSALTTTLTGFSVGANSAITSSDTVLGAFQKAQGQIAAKENAITAGTTAQYLRGDKSLSTFASDIWATVLTGLSTSTNAVIAATDTILAAFGKLQAQITANTTSVSGKADLTNVAQTITALSVTGLTAPSAGSDAANKTYVDSFGQWAKGSGSTINYGAGNVGVGTTAPNDTLEVNGTIRTKAAYNNVSSTTIDWSKGNTQYTASGCSGTAFTFSNMRDGGVYTLVVTGTFSASCTFGQTSPDTLSGTPGSGNFYFLPANATPTGSNVIYSFMRTGSNVYVTWNSGFTN